MPLNPQEQQDLINLSCHWGEVYNLAVLDGLWVAIPNGDPAITITAEFASELREKIRVDYAEHRGARSRPLSEVSERMST